MQMGLNFDTLTFSGALVILGHSSSAGVACVLMEWGTFLQCWGSLCINGVVVMCENGPITEHKAWVP